MWFIPLSAIAAGVVLKSLFEKLANSVDKNKDTNQLCDSDSYSSYQQHKTHFSSFEREADDDVYGTSNKQSNQLQKAMLASEADDDVYGTSNKHKSYDFDLNKIVDSFRKADVKPIPPDGKMESGDEGERKLKECITHHENFFGCECWLNKRIKEKIGIAGKEIDIIVLTSEKIYLFESKNYSGHLMKNPNQFDEKNKWIRIKRSYDGRNVSNSDTEISLEEDLTSVLYDKVNFLIEKLLEKGIDIDMSKVVHKVIFMKKHLSIDSNLIANFDFVTRDRLENFLNQEHHSLPEEKKVIMALIRYCLKLEGKLDNSDSSLHAISDKYKKDILIMNNNLINYIEGLPTWDHVILFGGKKDRGDILKLKKIFKTTENLECLNYKCKIKVDSPKSEADLINRYKNGQYIITLNIYDQNDKFMATKEGNPYEDSEIKIHAAGSEKPKSISIYQVEEIHLQGLYKISNEY